MNKLKLFIENFLIYGFGSIIGKIIPLIMVPIITRLMPDSSYFGISDLSGTIVSFGSAIAIMGMYDAMYRLFFEKDDLEYKKSVCSTAMLFTVVASFLVFFIMIMARKIISGVFFGDRQYTYLVCISAVSTLVSATNGIISAPTRMQNKRKVFLIMNMISPIVGYSVSIPMLLRGYYVIAFPVASVISGIISETIFGILNHSWFCFKQFDRKLLRPLLCLAIPLLPNVLIYWVFNSCDKIMITNLMGVSASGVYSVSAKVGHASQLIYTAFAGGWQYFAFATMKENSQVETNSKIFEYLGVISFSATMLLCACSKVMFQILFPEQYLPGYIVAPYLFLAPLLLMLFQVIANQFLVIKKTWPSMLILSSGAIINVVVNYFLIPVLGIEGASLATLLGYVISVVICSIVLSYMKLAIISGRFLISVLLMGVYMVSWRFFYSGSVVVGLLAAMLVTGVYWYLYRKEFNQLQGMMGQLFRNKQK